MAKHSIIQIGSVENFSSFVTCLSLCLAASAGGTLDKAHEICAFLREMSTISDGELNHTFLKWQETHVSNALAGAISKICYNLEDDGQCMSCLLYTSDAADE